MTLPTQLVVELRERRQALDLNQIELARRVGVSVSAFGRWERRETDPSLASFCAWSEELGCEVLLVPVSPIGAKRDVRPIS